MAELESRVAARQQRCMYSKLPKQAVARPGLPPMIMAVYYSAHLQGLLEYQETVLL